MVERELVPLFEMVLGALIDFPPLLDEIPEEHWGCISGDAALVVAVLHEVNLETEPEKFLASLPGSFQSFASKRLAAPEYSDQVTAKTSLVASLEKLQRLVLQHEKALLQSQVAEAESLGDLASVDAHMMQARAKANAQRESRARARAASAAAAGGGTGASGGGSGV
ncbi:MAG: hypothetical protein EOO74_03445 [Myxococcales bacterium]|nr:MAG: hypothetical protein EOO74_03445 [Myxococcales bacterium]